MNRPPIAPEHLLRSQFPGIPQPTETNELRASAEYCHDPGCVVSEETTAKKYCNGGLQRKPRLLDLFCCAGGAAMGYHRAGFDVFGVDIKPQPRYPFAFTQSNALAMNPRRLAAVYSAIHASPPCQRHSRMSNCRNGLADLYPDHIGATRELLKATGLPYIIENVDGAPLINPVALCGGMFGLETYRHRLFELNFALPRPLHPRHIVPTSKAGHWRPGTFVSVAGHCSPMEKCREAMGIDWMNREELAESIPPAYTEFIGRELMRHVVDEFQRAEDAQGGAK